MNVLVNLSVMVVVSASKIVNKKPNPLNNKRLGFF